MLARFREFLKTRQMSETSTVAQTSAGGTSPEPSKPPAEQWTMRILKAAQVEDLVLEKSQEKWGVASSTVYGPPEGASHGSHSGTSGGSGLGASGSAHNVPGRSSSPSPGQKTPSSLHGTPPNGGNSLPRIPGGVQPADLHHAPGEAKADPGRMYPGFPENRPDLLPSGEDNPPNLVLPPSDES